MYVKIKQFTEKYPWSVPVIIILVCLSCVWFYANRNSNIDKSGIRNAKTELQHVREYNQRATEYNHGVRNAVERSEVINERVEHSINRSIEANQRAEGSVDRSKELVTKARTDAERAKNIIGESRSILERAGERNSQGKDETTK